MLLLALGCARSIAPVLQLDDVDTVEAPEPADAAGKIAWIVAEDPLVRRPRLPSGELDGGLDEFRALATGNPAATALADLEARHRGTVVVPFARGARLAALEVSLADPAAALAWVLPLPADHPGQEQVRPPLAWLGATSAEPLLRIVERQVLLGWLDGPGVPVEAPARALEGEAFDRLALTPAGVLLRARAARLRDADAAARGRLALEEATWIAAMRAAADRDAEQATLRTLLAESAARAGTTGDPTRAHLTSAAEALAADAGDDASAGLALLAQAALRWEGGCPDLPCGGFDRVAAMETAGRWSADVRPLADIWRVIAAKDALDRLEVAYEQPSFPTALDLQVEVLIGTGGAPDRGVILYPRPGPPVHLALSRAAGGGDLTGKEDLFYTLRARVAAAAQAAAATAPERVREPLLRIARRAE
jgi:hypothetical protein